MRATAILFVAVLMWPSSAIGLSGMTGCKICNQVNKAHTLQPRSTVGALGAVLSSVSYTYV